MKLYVDSRYASPYAMSVFVVLREKRLPFEIHTIDLEAGRNHDAGFARTSLTHRVPTLVDGEFALSESSAIAEYLDDAYPQIPVLPTQLRQRARARQIQAWLRSDLVPIRQERPTDVIFYRRPGQPLSGSAKSAVRVLIDAAGELLQHGGDHLFGLWSIADTDLALMLYRLIANGDEVPAPVEQYARTQWARPSVQQWVNQERPPLPK
ncbi:MAG: glutathione transferase [Steroidobacterales bacterium]